MVMWVFYIPGASSNVFFFLSSSSYWFFFADFPLTGCFPLQRMQPLFIRRGRRCLAAVRVWVWLDAERTGVIFSPLLWCLLNSFPHLHTFLSFSPSLLLFTLYYLPLHLALHSPSPYLSFAHFFLLLSLLIRPPTMFLSAANQLIEIYSMCVWNSPECMQGGPAVGSLCVRQGFVGAAHGTPGGRTGARRNSEGRGAI